MATNAAQVGICILCTYRCIRTPLVGRLVAGRLVAGRLVAGRLVVGRLVAGRTVHRRHTQPHHSMVLGLILFLACTCIIKILRVCAVNIWLARCPNASLCRRIHRLARCQQQVPAAGACCTCDALLVVYACCYDNLPLFWVITLMYADTAEEVGLNSTMC